MFWTCCAEYNIARYIQKQGLNYPSLRPFLCGTDDDVLCLNSLCHTLHAARTDRLILLIGAHLHHTEMVYKFFFYQLNSYLGVINNTRILFNIGLR